MTALNPGAETSALEGAPLSLQPRLCWARRRARPAGLTSASPFPLRSEVPGEEACPLQPARNNPAAPRRSRVLGRPRREADRSSAARSSPAESGARPCPAGSGVSGGEGPLPPAGPAAPRPSGGRESSRAALPLSPGHPEPDWPQAGG